MLQDKQSEQNTRRTAWILSLGGFIPFAFLAVAIFMSGKQSELYASLFDIFKIWSIIILAFLGGIRWGFAIANEPLENRNLLLSVIPSILALFVVLLPDAYAILALLVLFSIHGVWDSFYMYQGKVVPWFGTIRMTLTCLVVAAHILVLFVAAS